MARVTHVKKAQQRYETRPVLDEDGNPKRTPVMRNGVQKTTKRGKPVFMTVTVQDKSKPLPPYTCDACRQPIEVGTPYKHITPKSGPYGGTKRTRHASCPTWQLWEYNNSLGAQLARISHSFSEGVASAEDEDEVRSLLEEAASEIEEIADQKQEGADNIESGFGHETSQSAELAEMADSLREWATEVQQADIPDIPECENCTDGQAECSTCDGEGKDPDDVDGNNECPDCDGSGEVECEECEGTGQDLSTWRDDVISEVTIIDEAPV